MTGYDSDLKPRVTWLGFCPATATAPPVRPTTNGVVLPTSRDRAGRSRGRCIRRGRLPVGPARRGSVPGRQAPSHTARGLLVGTSGVGTGRPGHRPLSPRTEAVCVCGMSPLGHQITWPYPQVAVPVMLPVDGGARRRQRLRSSAHATDARLRDPHPVHHRLDDVVDRSASKRDPHAKPVDDVAGSARPHAGPRSTCDGYA